MKCKVCGLESGKYPLCGACNQKKEQGIVIKCNICNQWHYKDIACPQFQIVASNDFLYELKISLISKSEQSYFEALKACVPTGYQVFPQVNLATFVRRTDDARYQNELFRNVDFLITDSSYSPKIAVEINDQSHLTTDRRSRDKKVQCILDEAGIPLLKLWTSYGINPEYIKKRIEESISSPIERKHIFSNQKTQAQDNPLSNYTSPHQQGNNSTSKKGCYVATCVYGSYDCPQVWTLRRYRDFQMSKTWCGRLFIKIYYTISPWLVKSFGKTRVFRRLFKKILDKKIFRLNLSGYADTPYEDDQHC